MLTTLRYVNSVQAHQISASPYNPTCPLAAVLSVHLRPCHGPPGSTTYIQYSYTMPLSCESPDPLSVIQTRQPRLGERCAGFSVSDDDHTETTIPSTIDRLIESRTSRLCASRP